MRVAAAVAGAEVSVAVGVAVAVAVGGLLVRLGVAVGQGLLLGRGVAMGVLDAACGVAASGRPGVGVLVQVAGRV
jgi:hypothetical protein